MKKSQLQQEQTSVSILCESYLLSELESFDEVINMYNEFKKAHPDKSILFTLDNLDQAEYTSSHATMSNDLDETEGYDLSTVDKVAFEDGEHIGYLSTPSEFFILKENFEKGIVDIDFSNVLKKNLTLEKEELELLKTINENPFPHIDEYIIAKIVPVDVCYKSIYIFPNGYFEGDLTPFESYAFAKYLYEEYQYELMGIGASLLGFIREEPLTEREEKRLAVDLNKLYNTEGHDINFIVNPTCLLLPFTESIDHLE